MDLASIVRSKADFLIGMRRRIHAHPELSGREFETAALVREELTKAGIEWRPCGLQTGTLAEIRGAKPGRTVLLRADMDALPVTETTGASFASCNPGVMHACGHDMHTTMMLGAARLLKSHEYEIEGTVKLMFQPAEEIFEGSDDMINAGVLNSPDVDAAMMIHVMAGLPIPAGTVISCDGGVSAPAADYFYIDIQGKGCHGSMPNNGVDPVTIAAHIITGLSEINSRELGLSDDAVITIGTINAGNAANVIPDTAHMSGTIRTYDEETRSYIKQRVSDIASNIASAYRGSASVTYGSGCPCLLNNPDLATCSAKYLNELLGPSRTFTAAQLNAMSGGGKASKSTGSEDFAYVSQKVPSIMFALAAGTPQDGYCYPQHHPKVKFDEAILSEGSAVYAYTAMRWLEEHK